MYNEKKTILVIFSDSSLGGTSRSALNAAVSWKTNYFDIVFYSNTTIHPDRLSLFKSTGVVLNSLAEVDWSKIKCVHFHYSNISSHQQDLVKKLYKHIDTNNAPPLICHNIFSANDNCFDNWPGAWTSTVLGVWSAAQYKFNYLFSHKTPFIVPNPQDMDFFYYPTIQQKQEAKEKLGLTNFPCILRVGSPHMAKWSNSYLSLAKKVVKNEMYFVAVSPPLTLSEKFKNYNKVIELSATSNDILLRDYYWAADVFALDANRGESFGNVILESLLCGTPVIYRAREYRDNTPWEFTKINNFNYANNENEFIELTIQKAKLSFNEFRKGLLPLSNGFEFNYGYTSFNEKLLHILLCLEDRKEGYVSSEIVLSKLMPLRKMIKVIITHNPVLFKIKLCKLKVTNYIKRYFC